MQEKRNEIAVYEKSIINGCKQDKTVSVIIVVLNGEAFLHEAIKSVLNQSLLPKEILVVDGNSTDNSAQIARSYPEVTLIKQENSGLADARNLGIEHASGQFIAFLDSDDVWHTDKLRIQITQFKDSPEIQYSFSNVQLFLQHGCKLRKGYGIHFLDQEHIGRTPGTLVVRKSLFDKIGKFDPSYKIACDVDWFTRVRDLQIKSGFTSRVLLHKRLHDSNLSGDVSTNRSEMLDVIRKSVERKKTIRDVVK